MALLHFVDGYGAKNPVQSYASVETHDVRKGEYLFQTHCNACHTIGKGDSVGPDLLNVTKRARSRLAGPLHRHAGGRPGRGRSDRQKALRSIQESPDAEFEVDRGGCGCSASLHRANEPGRDERVRSDAIGGTAADPHDRSGCDRTRWSKSARLHTSVPGESITTITVRLERSQTPSHTRVIVQAEAPAQAQGSRRSKGTGSPRVYARSLPVRVLLLLPARFGCYGNVSNALSRRTDRRNCLTAAIRLKYKRSIPHNFL